MSFVKDLDTPMLEIAPGVYFTPRDSFGGLHAFGGIGSGKSSSARMVAGAFLRAGYGGFVTVSKFSDIELWKGYAREHGRSSSLIVVDETEGFNFLSYELARQRGVEGIGSVVDYLMYSVESAKSVSAASTQRGGDPFWSDSMQLFLRRTIPPLYSASGSVSIPDVLRFISSAPKSPSDPTDPKWQKSSFMYGVMDAAARSPKVPMSPAALRDNIEFWAEYYTKIPEKTRGNIEITITSALDRFNHGRLNRFFCGRTSVVPELSFSGGILLCAMPTLTWNEDGIIAQKLLKFAWMRSVLSRNSLPQKFRERPLYLWSDEAQDTVSTGDRDGAFLGQCRDSKCAMVYLTQSLPAYYAKIGGDNPRDAAHSLAGKFMSHLYFTNSCVETNDFAARMIGRVVKRRGNYSAGTSQSVNFGMSAGNSENNGDSSSYGSSSGQGYSFNSNSGSTSGSGNNWGNNRGRGTSENESRGYSEATEFAIEPGDFARFLQTGGKPYRKEVTAIWFQSGRIFKTGSNFMMARFKQK